MLLAILVIPPLVEPSGVLEGIPFSTLTPMGVLLVVILFIVLGKLVPRRTMEDAIHDRDEWRTAHRISETARAEQAVQISEQAAQIGELLEHARTVERFMQALPSAVLAARQERDAANG